MASHCMRLNASAPFGAAEQVAAATSAYTAILAGDHAAGVMRALVQAGVCWRLSTTLLQLCIHSSISSIHATILLIPLLFSGLADRHGHRQYNPLLFYIRLIANVCSIGEIFCNVLSKTVAGHASQRSTTMQHVQEVFSLYSAAGHRKYLNHEERQRVLAVMTRLKTDHALLALTLAWSGARPSEVLALTPSSFQVTASLISMRTLKRRRAHVREVPIPPQLMRALADHFDLVRAQANPKRACTRLWPYCRVTAWRIIKTAMACARVGGVAATPRGLRHGFGVAT